MKDGIRRSVRRSVSSCLITGILIAAAICLSVARAHAEVWKNVTVISATGWSMLIVTVENVAGDSAIVIVSDDGARERGLRSRTYGSSATSEAKISPPSCSRTPRNLPKARPPTTAPRSVRRLLLLPAASAIAPQAPDESRISRRPRESRREEVFYGKRFNVMLAGGAGYSVPLGEWFEGMTSGFAGEAVVRLAVADNFYLGFSYKRQWLGIKKSYEELCFYDDYYNVQCIPVEWDIHLDEFYLAFGWMSPVSSYRTPFAYAEVGIGLVKHAITLSASVEDETASAETDETKFGMLLDAGVIFPFSDRIGLNVEADMRVTGEFSAEELSGGYSSYDPYSTSYSGSKGVLLGFRIGIVAMLGGGQ